MNLPQLTESLIRQYADYKSFSRGKEYYDQGAVLSVVHRGNVIEAEVEGSDVEPYLVTARFLPDGGIEAECTCPYDWGGWCKHIVAALLQCVHEPNMMEERAPLADLLATLDRDALQALLIRLAERNSGLTAEIEEEAERLTAQPVSTAGAAAAATPSSTAPRLAPIDPASLRKKVRSALKSVGRGGYDYWDDTGGYDELTEDLYPLIESAEAFTIAGDGRGALPALEAITEELVDGWDLVQDIVGDLSELFDDLGRAWAEAILTADLTDAERKHWVDALNRWRKAGKYCGAESGLEVAVVAAKQGWDYPPLLRVFQGEITEKGAWEGEAPDCADELAVARLNVLERQGRLQEAAYLAEAESQYDRYVALLVRLRRPQEAADFARDVFTQAEQALALAQILREHGETALALGIAEDGLTLQGPHYNLAIWLRDRALEEGKTDLALQAAKTALKESPRLADYRRVQEFVGDRWPTVREELLQLTREAVSWSSEGKVDIFLHEGLMADALNAVRSSSNYDLVVRVVEAATPTHPNDVIPICKAHAERIMDAGKADRYHYAAEWVARARDAYRAAGREAEWQAYKEQLLTLHERKYKLRPMLAVL